MDYFRYTFLYLDFYNNKQLKSLSVNVIIIIQHFQGIPRYKTFMHELHVFLCTSNAKLSLVVHKDI